MASNADRYHSYLLGWRHAATMRARDPRFLDHKDQQIRGAYLDGEHDGQIAAKQAAGHARKTFDHTPSILREDTTRSFPVTDPELDAPDGTTVDGYERHGETWEQVDKDD